MQSVTVSVNYPDLTAGGTSGSIATVGQPATFSSTVSNIGNGTASNFPNIIQIANSDASASVAMLNAGTVASLSSGASSAVSASYTFGSPGTYLVRTCANFNTNWAGSISESNGGNNCGAWNTVTVTYPSITGSCAADFSSAVLGTTYTWTASGISGGNGSYSYAWSGTEGLSGSGSSVHKTYTTAGTKSASVTVTSASNSQTLTCGTTVVTGCYGQGCGPTPPGSCETSGVCPCSYPSWPQPQTGNPSICCASGPNICAALPTASLTATPSTVDTGQSTKLTWSSTAATSCSSTGFSTGGATSNSSGVSSGGLTLNPTVFPLTCTGPGGTATSYATVTVLQPQGSISVNPTRVAAGSNTTITWNASQVKSCTVTGPGLSATDLSGSRDVPITSQSTFMLTCQTNGSPLVQTATVNILLSFTEF